MKIALSFLLAAALACTTALPSYAEPRQVIQGTQVHLTLLSGISSAVAKDGDPFVAVVAEPVYLGTQLLLPAGTRVNGIIGTVEKARHFSRRRGLQPRRARFRLRPRRQRRLHRRAQGQGSRSSRANRDARSNGQHHYRAGHQRQQRLAHHQQSLMLAKNRMRREGTFEPSPAAHDFSAN